MERQKVNKPTIQLAQLYKSWNIQKLKEWSKKKKKSMNSPTMNNNYEKRVM